MQLKRLIVAGLLAFGASCGLHAQPPLKVVSWGDRSYDPTWLVPPSWLPELVDIDGGNHFVVGLTTDSTLVGWGYFDFPNSEFFIPADVEKVSLVRAGAFGVLVVKPDGAIRIWGWGIGSIESVTPPESARGAIDAAIGDSAVVALSPSGTVISWGTGQIVSEMPTDLGPCVDVIAFGNSAAAVTASGEVRCWGNVSPPPASCGPPETLFAVTSYASAGYFFAALLSDHSVATWGNFDGLTVPPPPAELQGCERLITSAQGLRMGTIRSDGTAYVWGGIFNGAQVPMPQPGAVHDLALLGGRTFALIDEFTDCNANGLDDSAEIEAGTVLDCNGDWIPDTCQFATGVVEDCNANGIADACEKSAPFAADSGQLGPIGFGSPQTWTVSDVPAAATHVTLSLLAKGDFSSVSEYAIVRLNDEAIGVAFIDGADCIEIGPEESTILASTYNTLVEAGGDATFTFEPTIAVNANSCPGGTWITATLAYNGATELDCNANGLLDACEIDAGYADDCNLDSIPDSCQSTAADCNANGVWDACDIVSGAAIDCNGNGVPDSCDIGSSGEGDCNANGQFDACEIANGLTPDCDGNGRPDACDVADGTLTDCDANGLPDTCEIASGGTPDCNENGIPDTCDIDTGAVVDINNNGVPDKCEGLECPGDLTGDHMVNGADLAVLLGFWGPVGTFASADIDGSGNVDAGDLAILLGGWGTCN